MEKIRRSITLGLWQKREGGELGLLCHSGHVLVHSRYAAKRLSLQQVQKGVLGGGGLFMSQKGSKRKGNSSDTPQPADLPQRKTTTAVVHRYPDKKGTLEGILGYPFL